MNQTQTRTGTVKELYGSNWDSDINYIIRLVPTQATSNYFADEERRMPLLPVAESKLIKLEERIFYKKEGDKVWGNGGTRTIRYIEGQHSIFMDEQKEVGDNPKISYFEFNKSARGMRILNPVTDFLLLEFIRLSNKNLSNPKRDKSVAPKFYVYDRQESVQKIIDKDNDEIELIIMLNQPEKFELAMSVARVVLPNYDSIKINPKEVMMRLNQQIRSNFKFVKETLKNPNTIMKHNIETAIELGIYRKENNTIYNRAGGVIKSAPSELNPVDLFIEHVNNDITGQWKVMYSELLGLLGKATVKKEVKVEEDEPKIKEIDPNLSEAEKKKLECENILVTAIQKGIVKFSAPAGYTFMPNDATLKRSFVGKEGKQEKGIISIMLNEEDFFNKIKELTK